MIVGILGSVLFFPLNINNRYTCLVHRLFFHDHSYTVFTDSGSKLTATEALDQIEKFKQSSQKAENEDFIQMMHDALLKCYLMPFGLLWWTSLLFLALSIYWLKKNRSLLIGIQSNNAKP